MPDRLGMLGGTFDPPHVGHLIVAQDVCEGLALDRLLIVPAGDPPHRAAVLAEEVRFELVAAVFGGDPRFDVSRVELDRPGPSFTVDTLQWIRQTLLPAELYCVIGADQLRVIDTWSRYEDIPRLARLAVMSRDGQPPEPGPHALPFESVAVTRIDVSGSEIRRRLREGRSIRYLVPERIRLRVEREWKQASGAAPTPEGGAGETGAMPERNAE